MEKNSAENKNGLDDRLNEIDEALDECDRQLDQKFEGVTLGFDKLRNTLNKRLISFSKSIS